MDAPTLHFLLSSLLPQTLDLYDLASQSQKDISVKSRTLKETIAEARKQIEGLNGKDLSIEDQEQLLKVFQAELAKRQLPLPYSA